MGLLEELVALRVDLALREAAASSSSASRFTLLVADLRDHLRNGRLLGGGSGRERQKRTGSRRWRVLPPLRSASTNVGHPSASMKISCRKGRAPTPERHVARAGIVTVSLLAGARRSGGRIPPIGGALWTEMLRRGPSRIRCAEMSRAGSGRQQQILVTASNAWRSRFVLLPPKVQPRARQR